MHYLLNIFISLHRRTSNHESLCLDIANQERTYVRKEL